MFLEKCLVTRMRLGTQIAEALKAGNPGGLPKVGHSNALLLVRDEHVREAITMLTETLPREHAKIAGFVDFLPATEAITSAQAKKIYEENKHQIYSLAFWMTDNELEAEELSANVFRRAFRIAAQPTTELLDRALLAELRETQPVGTLTLHCNQANQVLGVRSRAKRIHLERAVIQLPATERLMFLLHDVLGRYPAGIGRLLGLTEDEVRNGLHQARLRMRELLASMAR